ncbi:hypothetical protein ACHAXS_006000 [Conticribra weissflogii]
MAKNSSFWRKWSTATISLSFFVLFLDKPPPIEVGNHVDRDDKCKFDQILERLENTRDKKYFVYSSPNMTLPHIRSKARDPLSAPTWGRQRWASRFKPYAIGELSYHEALERYNNTNVKTNNISDANFAIVSIPLGAAIFWGNPMDIESSFHHLFRNEPFFKAYPEKHVFITNNERLLRSDKTSMRHFEQCCGLSEDIISNISAGILVKDFDPIRFSRYILDHPGTDWEGVMKMNEIDPLFRHYWSIGYSHEASNPEFNLSLPRFETWRKKKFNFFLRTPLRESVFNSTRYRHALFGSSHNGTEEAKRLVQPSVVGQNVDKQQWRYEIMNSKYCLVIRGDNPSSRSLYTSIRIGCLPVIISDSLPFYQPLFNTLLRYEDFAIMIDETSFLKDPSGTLNSAVTSLSEADLRGKLCGLSAIQRILALDHPSSLFVEAFVHETSEILLARSS